MAATNQNHQTTSACHWFGRKVCFQKLLTINGLLFNCVCVPFDQKGYLLTRFAVQFDLPWKFFIYGSNFKQNPISSVHRTYFDLVLTEKGMAQIIWNLVLLLTHQICERSLNEIIGHSSWFSREFSLEFLRGKR